jgi:hypothetical protein
MRRGSSEPRLSLVLQAGFDDAVPDHSTFSKNRHGRFRESDLFRHLFNTVLARCIAEGLVGGESFGVDASLIKADASRYAKIETADWSVPRSGLASHAGISRHAGRCGVWRCHAC